jgi:hypothetical protein
MMPALSGSPAIRPADISAPATYQRILRNIEGRDVDINWVITEPMMQRARYLDEYLTFWTSRPEIGRVWLSVYTPQRHERSAEKLTRESRRRLVADLARLKAEFPPLVFPAGADAALLDPPPDPDDCTFARVSANYTADLKTRVQPCFFGGDPDCAECGCAVSAGLHTLRGRTVLGGISVGTLIDWTLAATRLNLRRRIPPGSPRRTPLESESERPAAAGTGGSPRKTNVRAEWAR